MQKPDQPVKTYNAYIEEIWTDYHKKSLGMMPTISLMELVRTKWPKLYEGLRGMIFGIVWQSIITALLYENRIKMLGVERKCVCEYWLLHKKCPHDIDILALRENRTMPLQLGTLKSYGDIGLPRWRTITNSVKQSSKKKVFSKSDFMEKKIRQTPDGGIAVIEMGDDTIPNKKWFSAMKKKCVILLNCNRCFLYCGMDGNADFAKELCAIFGFKDIQAQTVMD